MERRSDSHKTTVDLLYRSQIRLPSAANRSNQPSDGISEALSGCKITNEETKSVSKNVSYKKNCYSHKLKEMNGSDIFSDNGINEPNHKAINHYHQDQHSQISFSGEENATPKKPITLTEAAKQKEFSRTVLTESDSNSKKKKQMSNIKTKATTSGHDNNNFESLLPLPENKPCRSFASTEQEVKVNKNTEEHEPRNSRSSVKAASGKSRNKEDVVKSWKKIQHNPRFHQLTSNGIFKSDTIPPGYSEKMHSSAKLREMSGHNIFEDGKSEYRDYYGGPKRPPGGESSISLV
ncbi:unnamed protein product [Cochlearia groenlandica]